MIGGCGQDLEASGPARFADSRLDSRCGDRGESSAGEFFRGGNREREVAKLMTTYQRRLYGDFFSHDLKRIARDAAGFLVSAGHQVLRTVRADGRYEGNGAHGFRVEREDRVADDVVGFGRLG